MLSLVKSGAQFIGVTKDATPHIVYFTAANTIEATPVAGGAPVVLATGLAGTDVALVNGGAVAWFTGQSATTGAFSAAHIWTKTYGQKDITTTTYGLFAASDDGTRIALEVNAGDVSSDVAVTNAAAPVITAPALSGANAVNFASSSCTPQIGFASTTLVAAYCTGTASTATRARFATVASTETTPTIRIDNTAGGILPYWVADTTGTKFAVADNGGATLQAKVVITAGATTTVGTAESDIASLDIVSDGSAIVYRTSANVLKKATAAATPVISTLDTGVLEVLGATSDVKRFAYYTQKVGNTNDIKTIDVTSATPAPVVIAAAATALNPFFTGDNSRIVYLDEFDNVGSTWKLKSKPAAGGTEIVLDTAALGGFGGLAGSGVLSISAATAVAGSDTQYNITVKYSDAAVGGALKTGASNVLLETDSNAFRPFAWSGKTFVHTTLGTTPAVSKLVLP